MNSHQCRYRHTEPAYRPSDSITSLRPQLETTPAKIQHNNIQLIYIVIIQRVARYILLFMLTPEKISFSHKEWGKTH